MKNVVLFGGSFNPPHSGHFEMAKHLYHRLDVDEVWFLLSHNIDKDPALYAPLEHRMAMADIMNTQHGDFPFVISDAEYKTGTHLTADVLPKINDMFPDHRFIWAMGADNLAHFHLWEGHEFMIKNYPMAILNRSSYEGDMDDIPAFKNHSALFHTDGKSLKHQDNGIHFLDNPYIDLSSTKIRKDIKSGLMLNRDDLSAYIIKHRLYK